VSNHHSDRGSIVETNAGQPCIFVHISFRRVTLSGVGTMVK
jgi:hypothetical protein